MAYRYINVRLVDFDDPTYRKFIAPFLLARETHKGGPIRARVRFSQQVEKTLRDWMKARTTLLPRRVLGYTELGGGSARPAFRELDALEPVDGRKEPRSFAAGFFQGKSPMGAQLPQEPIADYRQHHLAFSRDLIVYEFKASRSPASLYRGLAQLKKSQTILSVLFRQVTGVLLFVYTDPERLPELHQVIVEAADASLMADWTERQELESPIGVILWPVDRIVEIAGEENLTLEWEDKEGKEILIERDQETWHEDWRAYQEEEAVEEPLSVLGAALLAALGEADADEEES